jgi:hypothetical protein
MEGFLLKKGRGESGLFGRRNWKRRWFVLDGSYLTYYEDFNPKTNILGEKKVSNQFANEDLKCCKGCGCCQRL